MLVFGKWCSDCKANLICSYNPHLCHALGLGWSWGFMCNNKQGKLEPKSQGSWCLMLTNVSSAFALALQASWSSMQRGCFAWAGSPMVSLGSTWGFQHRLPWLSLCRSRLFLSMLCLLPSAWRKTVGFFILLIKGGFCTSFSQWNIPVANCSDTDFQSFLEQVSNLLINRIFQEAAWNV